MRLLSVFLVLAALPALAAEPTLLRLSETAEREVANDRFTAHLEGRAEEATAAAAQATLNRAMSAALAQAEAATAIDAELVNYNVYARRHEDEPVRWIASQTLVLDTADREALLPLAAELQAQGLATGQLGAYLTRAGTQALRDELTVEALAGLERRAELVASTLGLTHEGWTDIGLDGQTPSPRALYAEARTMADAAPTPPSLTVGTTTVRVTVEATARLSPDSP